MISEFRKFDCETCPFCNCALDMHKDFCTDINLRHALCLFKCHNCGTVYEVVPVIASWQAHALEKDKTLYSESLTRLRI